VFNLDALKQRFMSDPKAVLDYVGHSSWAAASSRTTLSLKRTNTCKILLLPPGRWVKSPLY
jgi:hypothetical protein